MHCESKVFCLRNGQLNPESSALTVRPTRLHILIFLAKYKGSAAGLSPSLGKKIKHFKSQITQVQMSINRNYLRQIHNEISVHFHFLQGSHYFSLFAVRCLK